MISQIINILSLSLFYIFVFFLRIKILKILGGEIDNILISLIISIVKIIYQISISDIRYKKLFGSESLVFSNITSMLFISIISFISYLINIYLFINVKGISIIALNSLDILSIFFLRPKLRKKRNIISISSKFRSKINDIILLLFSNLIVIILLNDINIIRIFISLLCFCGILILG